MPGRRARSFWQFMTAANAFPDQVQGNSYPAVTNRIFRNASD